MKNTKTIAALVAVSLTMLLGGCASSGHGYTKNSARNQYMHVSQETKSFGYKRVGYIMGFRGFAIKSFIEEKGYPDYLHEYKSDGRECFIFYYIEKDKAYVFKEKNWRPNSAGIIEIRKLNEFEKNRFDI